MYLFTKSIKENKIISHQINWHVVLKGSRFNAVCILLNRKSVVYLKVCVSFTYVSIYTKLIFSNWMRNEIKSIKHLIIFWCLYLKWRKRIYVNKIGVINSISMKLYSVQIVYTFYRTMSHRVCYNFGNDKTPAWRNLHRSRKTCILNESTLLWLNSTSNLSYICKLKFMNAGV